MTVVGPDATLEMQGDWICDQLRSFGLSRESNAIPAIMAVLAAEDRWYPESTRVRRTAAWALGRIGLPVIHRILDKGGLSELSREGVADALGFVEETEGALWWLALLSTDKSDRVVLWAALSLAKHGGPAVPVLRGSLERTTNFKSAAHLMDALRLIATPEADMAIADYLDLTDSGWSIALRTVLAHRVGCGLPKPRSSVPD